MGLSFSEILVIFLVILLLFGAKRIPEIARSLGKASGEFKKARDGIFEEPEKKEEKKENASPEDETKKEN